MLHGGCGCAGFGRVVRLWVLSAWPLCGVICVHGDCDQVGWGGGLSRAGCGCEVCISVLLGLFLWCRE